MLAPADVSTDSYIILVDRTNITPKMARLRAEVKQLLEESVKKHGPENTYANVIFYDGEPQSVLGRIKPLDRKSLAKLNDAIDQMAPERGTRLDGAMRMAAQEINEHGKKTTRLILTDGDEDTLRKLKALQDALTKSAGEGGSAGKGNKNDGGPSGGKGDPTPQNKNDVSLPDRLRGAELIRQTISPNSQ